MADRRPSCGGLNIKDEANNDKFAGKTVAGMPTEIRGGCHER